MNMHPVMFVHPALHYFATQHALYVMWHRFDPKAGPPGWNAAFTRDCLAACSHAVRRIGTEPNPDNRSRSEREAG